MPTLDTYGQHIVLQPQQFLCDLAIPRFFTFFVPENSGTRGVFYFLR